MSLNEEFSIKTFIFNDSKRGEEENIEIIIAELCRVQHGYFIWPCSVVLAQYIFFNRHEFVSKSVCELGCGTSLCGLMASKCGSHVTLTDDLKSNSSLESLIEKSLDLNKITNIKIHDLSWSHFTRESFGTLPKVDIVICSDVFFDSASKLVASKTSNSSSFCFGLVFESLIVSMRFLLDFNNSSIIFYVTLELRSIGFYAKLEYLFNKYSLKYSLIDLKEFNANCTQIAQSKMPGTHEIYLLKLENQ